MISLSNEIKDTHTRRDPDSLPPSFAKAFFSKLTEQPMTLRNIALYVQGHGRIVAAGRPAKWIEPSGGPCYTRVSWLTAHFCPCFPLRVSGTDRMAIFFFRKGGPFRSFCSFPTRKEVGFVGIIYFFILYRILCIVQRIFACSYCYSAYYAEGKRKIQPPPPVLSLVEATPLYSVLRSSLVVLSCVCCCLGVDCFSLLLFRGEN